ncbi:hypothetical protein UFOVP1202_72 [uncultured Caudovirales phage]|uniref:Uncharacterized protein n=1 Tax=uncultured Caudovirales phage TaxID=2100421 RepID=A0A6J5R7T0_9CAUD|nr:hypothetical protein UFOVP1202_72 [uncultured Caudovirales phage]
MGKTTFSGPIRAGNIYDTTGTTLGTNVKNVGSVVMAQVFAVTQAGSATALSTPIVLPANSHILNIQLISTVAWSGAATTISVGTSDTATELVSAGVTSGAIGLAALTPGTDATRTANWDDTGTTDKRVFVLSANTGAGVGTLTVRYIQAHDLP